VGKQDALLVVLGQTCHDLFPPAKKERPAGMHYFNFIISEVHGLRVKELQDARKPSGRLWGSAYTCQKIDSRGRSHSVGICAGLHFGIERPTRTLL